MKQVAFKKILIWTLIITPFPLILCLSFGGPYSSYFLFKLFYPYTMLIASFKHSITKSAAFLGLAQYPVYGLLLAAFQKRIGFNLALLILACIHLALFMFAEKYVVGFS
jgi:hypothetical protein